MKTKITSILFLLLLTININAKTYKDIFPETNSRKYSVALHFGCSGYGDDLGLQQFLISTTINGVYFDFGGWPRSHGSDVRVGVWDDDAALTFHVGYQIPIQTWLRITQMIGYAYNAAGITNEHNWSVNSYGIHNSFHEQNSFRRFDYGAQLTFNIKHVNLCATLTRSSWYGQIGIEF